MDQKLQILREGETHGVDLNCRKHQISRSLYYTWKNKFNNQGPDGLAPRYHRAYPAIKSLEKENERLRKMVARQALELEVKEELLKNEIPIQVKSNSVMI